jgi:hypothetical protein
VDTGLARAASFNFSKDNGKILENAVFLHLKRRSNSLFYYKTKNNLEVDFLVREKEKNHSLIQVCWDINDPETMEREIKALKEAMEELNMRESVIVTHDNEDEIATEGMKITLVPAWKWFLEMND